MKSFVAAVIAVVVIAGAAYFVLDGMNQKSETAYTTSGARPR
jgi:hypothetical protein